MDHEDLDEDILKLDNSKKVLWVIVTALSLVGVIMVYSASYIFAKETYGSPNYLFFKQVSFLAFGYAIAFVIGKTKFDFWIKFSSFIHFSVMSLILLTFIPSIGLEVKGATRWIDIAGVNIQPGELIKYSMILYSYKYFRDFESMEIKDKIQSGIFLILPLIMVLLQPDYGTFSIGFLVLVFICFLSNFDRKKFYSILASGLILCITVLFMESYRVKRLLSFLDPWKNPKTSGFQIIQSYLAFANGSIFGTGLGNSNEKLFYLPEAHNDFIFSVIGEELGFLGVLLVVSLFFCLLIIGLRLAIRVEDESKTIIVSGIIFTVILQACLNMGVVLGLLPTKGLNLPFISAGGSSLLANFFAIGITMSAVTSKLKSMRAISEFESYPTYGHREVPRESKLPFYTHPS